MIYLDNAATSFPKPPEVRKAVEDALLRCGSLGRGGHPAAALAAETAYGCRRIAAQLFHARPEQVVFTMNATHGLNLAIATLIRPGDRVVVSGYEHNAVLRPLTAIGARIVPVRSPLFDQQAALEGYRAAITPETKAVIVNHVSNVFGFIQPLEAAAALCRERNVPLIVDAAQSAGVLPLSLEDTGAAFIAMPGHKGLCGPMGTGLLLCGTVPEPLLYGGTGSLSASVHMPDFLPDRAEAGTQNVPGIAGLLAGLRHLQSRGEDAVHRHTCRLKAVLARRLRQIPGVTVYAHSHHQSGVLSFTAAGQDCEQTAEALSRLGFAVRAGLHCAPMAHETARTLESGTVRAGFSGYNTEEEVHAFADAVSALVSGWHRDFPNRLLPTEPIYDII